MKHLDHEDRCAVVLGYSFYQKASEENFSLYKALRELLLEMRNEEAGADTEAAQTQRAEQDSGRWDLCGNGQTESHKVSADSRTGYDHAYTERMEYEKQNTETYEVTHKQRSGKARKNNAVKKIDWLFRIIHPAMLISGLFLLAVLEIVCYAGGLGITEAGGIFFLILSLELLLNKYLLNRGKKREKEQWLQEEEEEMYRILKDEMYEMPREKERIEQTQYLNNFPENEVLRLISVQAEKGGTIFPDICLDREIVCVGKLKGEVDVILDSPTVSRMHARLERRDGKFFVKDLNSRNGTFHNGRRLAPQEQCEITVGDRISFAEAGYQAVKL